MQFFFRNTGPGIGYSEHEGRSGAAKTQIDGAVFRRKFDSVIQQVSDHPLQMDGFGKHGIVILRNFLGFLDNSVTKDFQGASQNGDRCTAFMGHIPTEPPPIASIAPPPPPETKPLRLSHDGINLNLHQVTYPLIENPLCILGILRHKLLGNQNQSHSRLPISDKFRKLLQIQHFSGFAFYSGNFLPESAPLTILFSHAFCHHPDIMRKKEILPSN